MSDVIKIILSAIAIFFMSVWMFRLGMKAERMMRRSQKDIDKRVKQADAERTARAFEDVTRSGQFKIQKIKQDGFFIN